MKKYRWLLLITLFGVGFFHSTRAAYDNVASSTTNGGNSENFGRANNVSYASKMGIRFKFPDDQFICGFTVRVGKVGNPTDNMTASLYTNTDASFPTGTALANFQNVYIGNLDISTSGTNLFYYFNNNSCYKTTAKQYNWVVLSRSGALSDTDYYTIIYNGTGSLAWLYGKNFITPDTNTTNLVRGSNEFGPSTITTEPIVNMYGYFSQNASSTQNSIGDKGTTTPQQNLTEIPEGGIPTCSFLNAKDPLMFIMSGKFPFSYIFDICNLVEDLFQSTTTNSLIVPATPFAFTGKYGTTSSLTVIDETNNTVKTYADLLRTPLRLIMWLLFALKVPGLIMSAF